jgi:L-amino acid N-acyltransferase YncA
MIEIRDATLADAVAIADLTNALLATTTYEWTDEPRSPDYMIERLVLDDPAEHPTFVAVDDDVVVGWAGYGDFRDTRRWPGYRPSIEHTIHVAETCWGRGVGRRLMEALMDRARADDRHVIVAAIDGENVTSIGFHQRLGFVEVGRLPEMGTKFGRPLDLVLLHRFL